MSKKYRIIIAICIGLLFIAWIVVSAYLYSIWFSFKEYFSTIHIPIYYTIWIMLLFFVFRNYLFIPSTAIIIISWIIFKDFTITAIVSMIWVSLWLIETYFIGYFFREIVAKKKIFKLIQHHSDKIEQEWAKVIFLWAISPSLPTDAFCYAAWLMKYNFIKFYIAATLWELPLVLLYSYLGIEAQKYSIYFIYFMIVSFVALGIYYYIKYRKNRKNQKNKDDQQEKIS